MSKVTRVAKPDNKDGEPATPLRRGWTTGACATAATKAALTALLEGEFPDPVRITLPKGETPDFALAQETLSADFASAGIVKDAGDDPDVTHGATIISKIQKLTPNSGIIFKAGEGVGTVTKAGLPIAIGEASINPVPRKMMIEVVETLCIKHGIEPDIEIEISVPGGEKIAERTWNPRLGILGGISILGTTGIVHPFSCSAWIHSIHRGIDVSRANGIRHVLGATGSTSESGAQKLYDFPDEAMLDMGDFVGGLLKYLRKNPIPNLTLAGGFAKFTKLAQGAMDLHSGRSQVDLDWLAGQAASLGLNKADTNKVRSANTAMEALEIAADQVPISEHIAELAKSQVEQVLGDTHINIEILIFARDGTLLTRVGKLDV